MSDKRQVLRAAGIVGGLTFFSRLTGLLREVLLASLLGASRLADTFQTSFELVNQSRRILGEGALSSFVVPFLNDRRAKEGSEGGWLFFNRTINLMLLVALFITLVGIVFSREIFNLYGGFGLGEDESHYVELGVKMTRLMFPVVIGLTIAAMMMGACHTLRRFTAPSLGSVMLNISLIAVAGFALHLKKDKDLEPAAFWLCWAVLVGAGLRIIIMIPTLYRNGWRWKASFNVADPDLRKLLRMMGIGLVTMFIQQLQFTIAGNLAMHLGTGMRTYVSKANYLVQFPMALTATAVATAMLPQLSQYLVEGRSRELNDMMAFTKRLEILLMAPAIMGLIFLGLPIIEMLFEYGNWTHADSHGAYWALLFYAPGLLPLGWSRLLHPLYYAKKDMMTPLKAACAAMLVNVLLNLYFAFYTDLKQGGLGLANTLAALTDYLILSYVLKRKIGGDAVSTGQSRLLESSLKCLLAAALACGAGYLVHHGLDVALAVPDTGPARALLILPVIFGVALIYFSLVRLFRTPDADTAMEILRKKFKGTG
jgi:putative peptidoglycan lipid II flippase